MACSNICLGSARVVPESQYRELALPVFVNAGTTCYDKPTRAQPDPNLDYS